jgi:hypothetical protein
MNTRAKVSLIISYLAYKIPYYTDTLTLIYQASSTERKENGSVALQAIWLAAN